MDLFHEKVKYLSVLLKSYVNIYYLMLWLMFKLSRSVGAQGVTLLPAHIIDTICKLPIVIVAK